MLVAFAALLLSGQATTITFESPGITVKAFCAELSRQTGRTYVAKDEVQSDLLAIRVTNVPLDELIKKIRFVERAKLQFDGSSYILRPDVAARANLRAARRAIRVKKVEAVKAYARQFLRSQSLDATEARAIAKKLSDNQAKEDEMNAAGNDDASVNLWVENEDQSLRLPTGQAMLAMFEAIPTEELAALDADHEGVWSTAPTPIERRTAIEPAVLLTGLAKDHAVWQEAGAAFLSSSAAKFFDLKPAEDSRIAETALLRLSFSGSFVVDFTGFDGAGNMLFENVKSLRTQSAVKESTAETDRISPAEPKLKPVPIPTSTEKLIRLWSAYPTAEEERAWASDQDFMKRYFSPEQYDPVAETYGRALVEIAGGRDRQLVAVETGQNAWALPETSTTRGKINLDPIETMLRNSKNGELENIQYTMDPIWITACPADLDEAASEEFSRTSLGTFLRAARDHGAISLMDVARYAADQPHYFGSRSTRALGCLEALLPGLSGANLMNAGEWPIKCFLGRLDAPQVSVAQQASGLSLASCKAGQLEALSYAFRFTRFAARGRKDVWRSFPTDALPNGLPGDGVLHLATSTGQSVWARIKYPGGWVSSIYFAPEDFAKWLRHLDVRVGEQYELLGIRPAGRTTYTFRFDFPNEITTTETLDDDAPAGPEVKTVDDLPESLRSQVKAAIQKAGSHD